MPRTRRPVAAGVLIGLIALTTGFIWFNSLQNGTVSMDQSDQVQSVLVSMFGEGILGSFLFAHIRKVAHVALFFVLGGEWCALSLLGGTLRRRWWWLFMGAMTAVADECLQLLSPGRSPAVTDVLLDWSGYLGGAAAVWLVGYWRRRRRQRKKGLAI